MRRRARTAAARWRLGTVAIAVLAIARARHHLQDGRSALQLASEHGHLDVVKLMLKTLPHGLEIDATDRKVGRRRALATAARRPPAPRPAFSSAHVCRKSCHLWACGGWRRASPAGTVCRWGCAAAAPGRPTHPEGAHEDTEHGAWARERPWGTQGGVHGGADLSRSLRVPQP